MPSGFEIEGLYELRNSVNQLVDELPELKYKQLLKSCYICTRDIALATPVDSGRLRASLTFSTDSTSSDEYEGKVEGGIDVHGDSARFGTNVNYAQAVEDGFTVNQRFVPGHWEGSKFKYEKGADEGMMLHPQFVLGRHMFKIGMQNAEPKVNTSYQMWLEDLLRKLDK